MGSDEQYFAFSLIKPEQRTFIGFDICASIGMLPRGNHPLPTNPLRFFASVLYLLLCYMFAQPS